MEWSKFVLWALLIRIKFLNRQFVSTSTEYRLCHCQIYLIFSSRGESYVIRAPRTLEQRMYGLCRCHVILEYRLQSAALYASFVITYVHKDSNMLLTIQMLHPYSLQDDLHSEANLQVLILPSSKYLFPDSSIQIFYKPFSCTGNGCLVSCYFDSIREREKFLNG